MRSIGPLWSAVGLSMALGVVHGLGAQGSLESARRLELAAYDTHYRLRNVLAPSPPPHERLVLLAYDDETRALEREYPSPRHLIAEATEKLADEGAALVFLDYRLEIPYLLDVGRRVENARSLLPPGADAADRELRAVVEDLQVDDRLAAAIRRVPTAMMLVCVPGQDARDVAPSLVEKAGALEPPARMLRALPRAGTIRMPLPILTQAARHLAQSCEFTREDAVVRTDPAVLMVSTPIDRTEKPVLLPSISVLLARELLGDAEIVFDGAAILIGSRRFPLGPDGEVLLGLSGPGGSFRGIPGRPARYSLAAFLRGKIPKGRLHGKVVLTGETMIGTRDTKVTSFGSGAAGRVPGVEKIAMQADYLASDVTPLHRPLAAARWGFLFTVAAGCVAAWLGARLGFYPALGLVLPGGVLIFATGTASLVFLGAWVDSAFPAVTWSVSLFAAALVRYSQEISQRRFLESAFERYLPREMVRSIVRDPSVLKLAGEEKEMTVLFADLRGFTSFSEGHSASEVVGHLNEHLTAMSEAIQKHGGTVDKFIGDAVMAFWNAPLPDPLHAVHACQAARAMLEVLERQNAERIVRGLPEVDMGIGVNTGPMIVGNMGSARRFNYTVIGDAVNTASRLESLTKELGVRVLVGQRTRDLAAKVFAFRALGEFSVKGKADRVPVHSLETAAPAAAESRSHPAVR